MHKTELFFPFEPIPKGRPRYSKFGHEYTPSRTREYEKSIADFYRENCSDYYASAIKVSLVFNMPIPNSASKKNKVLMSVGIIKCIKHNGDIDNLAKSVLDALNGVAFQDDCLITKLSIIKKFASDNNVGTEMVISEDVD